MIEFERDGVAIRENYISEDVKWYSEKEKWKKLKTFGRVKKMLKRAEGSIYEECCYYICGIGPDGLGI